MSYHRQLTPDSETASEAADSAHLRNGSDAAMHTNTTLTAVTEETRSRSNSLGGADGSAEEAAPAATPAVAAAATAPPVATVPALIVQHSSRRLLTYLHSLVPRYSPSGVLERYDPLEASSSLAVHEDYKLDGEYHWVTSARGKVQARAYMAPHGQSVVVDTRCASKYDLERSERFLDQDGKRLIIETRILSCAPDSQQSSAAATTSDVSQKSSSPSPSSSVSVAPGGVVVKELLFLRRVFKRILDADPASKKDASAQESNANNRSEASTSDAQNKLARGKGDIAAARMSLPSYAASFLPADFLSPAAAPIQPTPTPSIWSRVCDQLLYPRHVLLREYDLSSLLTRADEVPAAARPTSDSAFRDTLQAEQVAYASARRSMHAIDLVLIAIFVLIVACHFGVATPPRLHAVAEAVSGLHATHDNLAELATSHAASL